MRPDPDFRVKQTEIILSAAGPAQFPDDRLPQVAFVGRSNVGKSSLLNTLANRRQLAHVSGTPGRTQLVNFFRVNGDSYFVDLPGYGFAKAPDSVKKGWEKLITGYLSPNLSLRAVVALFDIRRERTAEDIALLDWLAHRKIPAIAVLTKCDKLPRARRMDAMKTLRIILKSRGTGIVGMHLFSALSREGKDELLAAVGGVLRDDPDADIETAAAPNSEVAPETVVMDDDWVGRPDPD